MSKMTSIQKVVGRFWDSDLPDMDTEKKLVVLGNVYEPYSPAPPDPQREAEGEQDKVVPEEAEMNTFDAKLNEIKTMFNQFVIQSKQKPQDTAERVWPQDFIYDVGTRIWFTYRSKFPEIPRAVDGPSNLSLGSFLRGQVDLKTTGFTSDAGWGCMIRTSQSLLANALLNLHVGREWRYDPEKTSAASAMHDKIVSWFVDVPSAPLSIHNFVAQGGKCSGKKPGEWFGPSAASKSIEMLCSDFPEAGLVVITGEGDFYEDQILEKATTPEGKFKPVLLLAGVRLGINDVNSVYWDALKQTLSLSQSVGIAGGRPSSSHYFFGYQGDYLFYLDPHLPQKALIAPTSMPAEESDEDALQTSNYLEVSATLDFASVHTTRIRQLNLKDMDPSMLIGFLIKDRNDYDEWKSQLMSVEHKIVYIYPKSISQNLLNKRSMSVIDIDDEFVDLGADCDLYECAPPAARRFSQPVMIDSGEVDEAKSHVAEILREESPEQIGNPDELSFDKDTSVIVPEEEAYEDIIKSAELSETEEPTIVNIEDGTKSATDNESAEAIAIP